MKALKIGRNTAYKLLANNDIKAFRVGNKWKIPKSSVEQYIKAQTQSVQ